MISGNLANLVGQFPRIEAFLLGAHKLKLHVKEPDAPRSPFYINLRVLRSYPEFLPMASRVLGGVARDLNFDRIADVPTAATPFVTLMSVDLRVPMISPRMNPKTHGLTGQIDGVFSPGLTTLLVDDLVTKATSKIEAINVLRNNGLVVTDVVVLFDREQGGREELSDAGVRLHSAVTITELLSYYAEREVMSKLAYDTCMRYLQGKLPSGWQDDMEPGWDKLSLQI